MWHSTAAALKLYICLQDTQMHSPMHRQMQQKMKSSGNRTIVKYIVTLHSHTATVGILTRPPDTQHVDHFSRQKHRVPTILTRPEYKRAVSTQCLFDHNVFALAPLLQSRRLCLSLDTSSTLGRLRQQARS